MQLRAVSFNDAAKKRILDAAAFEKKLRMEAVVGVDQEIAGLKLRQISVRDLLHLEFTENRLTMGEEPCLEDLMAFVLMLSNDKPFFKSRYAKKVGSIIRENEDVRLDLICYFNAAFTDMPSGVNPSGVSEKFDSTVSVVTLVDGIAFNYGWTLDDILDTPVSTALQLLQRILQRSSEGYSPRNAITQQAKAKELNRLKENG